MARTYSEFVFWRLYQGPSVQEFIGGIPKCLFKLKVELLEAHFIGYSRAEERPNKPLGSPLDIAVFKAGYRMEVTDLLTAAGRRFTEISSHHLHLLSDVNGFLIAIGEMLPRPRICR